ncbi:MAG: hypothetical protein GXC76_12310 [Rhodanobacteraceae bacterium]|nr:hypothetical protein [Rhodanobacteraceae bacterium]
MRTMPDETTSQPPRAHAFGIATALMCALAGGAVWCLLSLYSRSELAGFAFVVAVLVAWVLRAHGHANRISGALLAAACVVLASLYAFYLQAIAQVAALLGLPMRVVLRQMGADMALAITRTNLAGWNLFVIAAAAALAAGLMLRRTRTRQGKAQPPRREAR